MAQTRDVVASQDERMGPILVVGLELWRGQVRVCLDYLCGAQFVDGIDLLLGYDPDL